MLLLREHYQINKLEVAPLVRHFDVVLESPDGLLGVDLGVQSHDFSCLDVPLVLLVDRLLLQLHHLRVPYLSEAEGNIGLDIYGHPRQELANDVLLHVHLVEFKILPGRGFAWFIWLQARLDANQLGDGLDAPDGNRLPACRGLVFAVSEAGAGEGEISDQLGVLRLPQQSCGFTLFNVLHISLPKSGLTIIIMSLKKTTVILDEDDEEQFQDIPLPLMPNSAYEKVTEPPSFLNIVAKPKAIPSFFKNNMPAKPPTQLNFIQFPRPVGNRNTSPKESTQAWNNPPTIRPPDMPINNHLQDEDDEVEDLDKRREESNYSQNPKSQGMPAISAPSQQSCSLTSTYNDMERMPPPPRMSPLSSQIQRPKRHEDPYSPQSSESSFVGTRVEVEKEGEYSSPRNVRQEGSATEGRRSKKIKIKMIEVSQISIQENPEWIRNIGNSRLEWKSSKAAPLEIRVMLNELLDQVTEVRAATLFEGVLLFEGVPISEPISFSERFDNYKFNPDMLQQVKSMAKEFPVYRRVKGDGNCFYRAFNFSFLEMSLTHESSLYFLRFLQCFSDTSRVKFHTDFRSLTIKSNPQLTPEYMRSFVIQRLLRLYSYRVTLIESNDVQWEHKIIAALQTTFNESGLCFDTFLVIGIKNYIIRALSKLQEFSWLDNRQEIEEEILTYCKECAMNQYCIKALSEDLCVCMSLFEERSQKCAFETYGNPMYEKIILYYRPGHYDIVYPNKRVYQGVGR